MSIFYEDGLSEYSIRNNINNHGRFSWILDENVKNEKLVIGLDSTNNLSIKSGFISDVVFNFSGE